MGLKPLMIELLECTPYYLTLKKDIWGIFPILPDIEVGYMEYILCYTDVSHFVRSTHNRVKCNMGYIPQIVKTLPTFALTAILGNGSPQCVPPYYM
jgi:hypothetical protein